VTNFAVCRVTTPRARGWPPEAPALGPSIYEGVPQAEPGCSAVGASAGAVDPKTRRKWVCAFIDAVANLVDIVVSKITMWGPVRE